MNEVTNRQLELLTCKQGEGMNRDEINWLVESRSNVQGLLLALWMIDDEGAPTGKRKLEFQLLQAICFALWRAVFLAHGERTDDTIDQDAKKFLEALIRDNAITYTQDRESKAWTFGYYLNDAYFRLDYYHKTFTKLDVSNGKNVIDYLAALGTEGGQQVNAKVAWTNAYLAALSASESLVGA